MTEVQPSAWVVEAFFDGDCPLCVREVGLLRRLDGARARIRWTDIASPEFDPAAYGKSLDELMDSMHGRLPDGTWIQGVEVFRRLYAAVGFGVLVAPTRLPGISWLADRAYEAFARNRLRLTGRCRDGVCSVPSARAAG